MRKMSAYFDGELPENERENLEAHLAGCAECRAGLASIREMSAVFAAADLPEMSPDMLSAVQKRALAGSRGSLWTAGALAAASIALILASTFLLRPGAANRVLSDEYASEWERAASTGWYDTYNYTDDGAVQLAYGFFTAAPEEDTGNE